MALAVALIGAALAGGTEAGAASGRPNVVMILTDDQVPYELAYMPQTLALIRNQGTEFSRFYDSYPLCCPSRTTFLTGQYMHNHHVRGNGPPNGGAEQVKALGSEATMLPTWLQAQGYDTAHVGKYLNGYADDGNPYVPPGWKEWYGQLSSYDPSEVGGKLFYNYTLLEKGLVGPATLHNYGSAPADYQTDVLQTKALNVLNDFGLSSNPFYLEFAPNAPHYPFTPAPKYAGTMANAPLPQLPGRNERNISDKPYFLRHDAPRRLKANTLAVLDAQRRMRLEQLRSVDDTVAAIVAKLAAIGKLDNTYIIFTSDNGYFFGEHRIVAGKYLPYEPSSRVPFLIRGPGIPPGGTTPELSANVDFAPTVADVTGSTPTLTMDGRSLLPFAANPSLRTERPVLLEGDIGPGTGSRRNVLRARSRRARILALLGLKGAKGVNNLEQEAGAQRFAANGDYAPAYRSIRSDRYVLTIYSTGDVELYDMAIDPAQLNNRAKNPRYKKVKNLLLSRLISLASCQGPSCRASYGPDPKPVKKKHKRK